MAAVEADLSRLEIRPLTALDEFHQTLDLQKSIWGFDETDSVAPRLFSVYIHIGGSVLGAFMGERMVGYTLAFAAFKPDTRVYWHSHMAGVDPAWQNRGIGRRLKLRQREEGLRAGIDLIEWTFDPLQARNAYFNIERLGVVIDEYLPNLYGVTSSELHGALPTDRLVASWRLDSPRVVGRLAGSEARTDRYTRSVEIPADAGALPNEQGLAVQTRVREQFRQAFDEGLSVTGFETRPRGGVYRLSPRVR